MMESRPRDVLDLWMTPHSGWKKDNYGRDVVPPLPLSFDRINEGRPPKSTALLFQQPFEIIGAIAQLIPPDSLNSLALVNTDCRQLARSRRFASVRLDYTYDSLWLTQVLLEEAVERGENRGLTWTPSLGACIRRLQVAADPKNLPLRYVVDIATLKSIGEELRAQRLQALHARFFGSYIPAIQSVLPLALPHLEFLDFADQISMPRSFFNAISCSSIQHLKLDRVWIEEEFEIALPGALAHPGWRLRSLHLELNWRLFDPHKGRTSLLCASILRHCAPTLESLTWQAGWRSRDDQDIQSFDLEGLEPPQFARLRDLKLGRMLVGSSTIVLLLCAKPQSRLQVLELDTESDPVRSKFFETCGTIPSLETFVWATSHLPADHTLSFLSSNPQISKLSVTCQQSPNLLETKLLPLLSHLFWKLKSLNLTWDAVSIPDSALEQIGGLQSLRQLSLSAGEPFGWQPDWVIDHLKMRRYLGNLQNLRKIAFRRDSYQISRIPAENYYGLRTPVGNDVDEIADDLDNSADPDPDQERGRRVRLWEQQHRQRMLLQAREYLRLLPKLGQIPMGVADSAESRGREAVALSEERDECRTLLRRMFGRENAA
jgi:hypothetical protein